jgi:hypothetical protein
VTRDDPWGPILDAAAVADVARRELRAELRAKVEALDGLRVFHNGVAEKVLWLQRDDVLDLIDEDDE